MVQEALDALTVGLAESPTGQGSGARPESSTESIFAELLADVVQIERVSVDSNFFDDLGADSMVMAQFCARVRKRPDLPSVSIKDIYQHPTVRSLATALTDATPTAVAGSDPASIEAPKPASTQEYLLCGALQLLSFLGYSYLAAPFRRQTPAWGRRTL